MSFLNQQWNGCKAKNKRPISRPAPGRIGKIEVVEWYEYALPTCNQNGSSCVGHAWANWLEMMIRRYQGSAAIPRGMQIDGEAIYACARELWWLGAAPGGIYLEQGFGAMLHMGIIPPEARLVAVNAHREYVAQVLMATPVIQAHQVHQGWMRPDPMSGLIDHAPSPQPGDEYHATVLLALGHGPNGVPCRIGQNSWGSDWARYGYFVMTEDEWFEGFCPDGLYTARLPENWADWQDWKELLVKTAQNAPQAAISTPTLPVTRAQGGSSKCNACNGLCNDANKGDGQ